ncbi:hypothetical protein SAMD00023353_0402040 [Rosellinia necatrix]|uniref:Uncharacterized protein n=1 Tax=Rosellinia necatrix TaxID=77044 RepID=A0A1S8A5B5_ROSNE|nr:hypothetical protein SAMD00023353_0402040 [Rosellinia necatrix]
MGKDPRGGLCQIQRRQSRLAIIDQYYQKIQGGAGVSRSRASRSKESCRRVGGLAGWFRIYADRCAQAQAQDGGEGEEGEEEPKKGSKKGSKKESKKGSKKESKKGYTPYSVGWLVGWLVVNVEAA